MSGMGEMRLHFFAVGAIILANSYILRLMETGFTAGWFLFLIGALMLGSCIYVGLVLGVGGGILVSTSVEVFHSIVRAIRNARQRVVERSGAMS